MHGGGGGGGEEGTVQFRSRYIITTSYLVMKEVTNGLVAPCA